jgi:hypothetical protein
MDKATFIEVEAQRIVKEMRNLREPNSPNKTHYMVELSREFLVEDGRTDRLFSLLPYKTLSFSNLKDRKGIFAFVRQDEPRDKDIRTPRRSDHIR